MYGIEHGLPVDRPGGHGCELKDAWDTPLRARYSCCANRTTAESTESVNSGRTSAEGGHLDLQSLGVRCGNAGMS
jgi:hypothetical protein